MKTIEETINGCEHDGSFIPVNEVKRLMKVYARQEIEKHLKIAAKKVCVHSMNQKHANLLTLKIIETEIELT